MTVSKKKATKKKTSKKKTSKKKVVKKKVSKKKVTKKKVSKKKVTKKKVSKKKVTKKVEKELSLEEKCSVLAEKVNMMAEVMEQKTNEFAREMGLECTLKCFLDINNFSLKK